jgi:twitching motility protein PilT
MDLIYSILQKAITLRATDIHLAPTLVPVYRVNRKLFFDESKLALDDVMLVELLEFFWKDNKGLQQKFESKKQADFSYSYNEHRFRINVSLTKGVPTFSIRVIPNGEIDVTTLGIKDIIQKMKKINSGLLLLTGKVNSGKSTTMNAFLQEINKTENKKIVMLEDPIEYEHVSNKSIVIQKEIGEQSDVIDYSSGLINLLREDSDISVLGEIRDRKTMDVAIDLAESGGLVIGTLHTRSCGETIERIINMYDPEDQSAIKNSVSSVLKMVVSQRLLVSTRNTLVLVPEIMIVNNTLAAQIRQEKFSVSDIEDSIHSLRDTGCLSYEYSFADMYARGILDMPTVVNNVDPNRLNIIKNLVVSMGGEIV